MPTQTSTSPEPVRVSQAETQQRTKTKINLVLFSGGSGTRSITEALLKHPQISLKILINAYDDGHSTGRLRRFIPGMLGPSDVRKNINRLMPVEERCQQALRSISDYRLPVGIEARAVAGAACEARSDSHRTRQQRDEQLVLKRRHWSLSGALGSAVSAARLTAGFRSRRILALS